MNFMDFKVQTRLLALAALCVLIAPAIAFGQAPNPKSVNAIEDHDVYYPGTETLKPDEMRVTACGTGMPNARPKQAAACWLVELGNGDKFLFDIGSGSAERISALKIPYDFLDKVFIGHLHSDHFGDIGDLWIGGVIGNRINKLRVWGPSGSKPEYGTAYALDHMEKMFTWDSASRLGNVDIRGQVLEVNEFDYKAVNEVIYSENGVVIRSIPAVHALDGSVSFILEWNGLTQQVVDRVHQGRGHRHPRVFHHAAGPHRKAEMDAGRGVERRHPGPHVTLAVRQGDEHGRASYGRGLPLLQRL